MNSTPAAFIPVDIVLLSIKMLPVAPAHSRFGPGGGLILDTDDFHNLLRRQLRRSFPVTLPETESFAHFLNSVDAAYRQADEDRIMLERSMEPASRELIDRYRQLESDLDLRRKMQAEKEESLRQFQVVFELAPTGMVVSSLSGRLLRVNQALAEMTGYTIEELQQMRYGDLVHEADLTRSDEYRQRLVTGKLAHFSLEKRLVTKSGGTVYALLKTGLLLDEDRTPRQLISQIVDITERRHAEKKLEYAALHDALTGLPNRTMLMRRIESALLRCRSEKDYDCALLFMDLDRFKILNDSLGHIIGDELLVEMAARFKEIITADDVVARLGGDEFIILMSGVREGPELQRRIIRVQDAVAKPFTLRGLEVATTVSVGVALGSGGYRQPEDMLRDADAAMYRAKAGGRGRIKIFDVDMHQHALEQLELDLILRQAIEYDEFYLAFQPIVAPGVETGRGRIVACEALLRLEYDNARFSIQDLIRVAEDSDIIYQIGDRVLKLACQFARELERFDPDLRIAVNVSSGQFTRPDFCDRFFGQVRDVGIEPRRLELELTESVLLQSGQEMAANLQLLRDAGVRLSIDDFGTGYSSLAYLKDLPIDTLKIDRSFIQELPGDPRTVALCDAILALGHGLDLEIIAEGVETAEQWDFFRDRGCDQIQGFFFQSPLPGPEFLEFLRKHLETRKLA